MMSILRLFLKYPKQAPAPAQRIVDPLRQGRQFAAWIHHAGKAFAFLRLSDLGQQILLAQAETRYHSARPLSRAQMTQSNRQRQYRSGRAAPVQLIESDSVLDRERSAGGPPQNLEMSAATKLCAHVRGQRTNLSATRTGYFELDFQLAPAAQVEGFNMN